MTGVMYRTRKAYTFEAPGLTLRFM